MRLDQALVALLGEPRAQPLHERPTAALMRGQALGWAALRLAGLGSRVSDVLHDRPHHLALLGQPLCEGAARAPTMGQAVAAEQP